MNPATRTALAGLARADRLRRQFRDRLGAMPGRRARVHAAETRLETDLAQLIKEAEEVDRNRRAREQEVAKLDERVARDAAGLNAIRNNTEYQAMLKQLAENKTRQSASENDVLELMEREEELGLKIESETVRIEGGLEKLKGERKILDDEERREREALTAVEGERQGFLGGLEPGLRARYDRLANAEHGLAVVAVSKGACGGCFASLPPQRVNEVRLAAQLVFCDACSRILIWDEEMDSE